MSIPETKLETWSHRGAVQMSKDTHLSIRKALTNYQNFPANINFDVYLQGSYRNHTNIRGDSDVDVVIELKSAFYRDISKLSENETKLYLEYYNDSTYTWKDFRLDVLNALKGYYGDSVVTEGKKSLKLGNPNGGRLPADIVVCLEHRNFLKFLDPTNQYYIEGMTFYVPFENRWIIGYPKLHYENSTKKNSSDATDDWYKPVVRIFKNAREYLIDNQKISNDLAPSYFIEGLIYNVPNKEFGTNFNKTVYNILYWLNNADYSNFVCPNEQLLLFGNSPEQWSEQNARAFLSALIGAWNNW